MADQRRKATTTSSTFLHNLKTQMPSPTQLLSLVTFITTSSVLILFTGSTLIGILIFAPLMIVSIPIWFPIGAFLFTAVSGFLLFCGFSVTAIVGLLWTYRYFRGMHPPGADRVDYARSRIYDTANHVKDYAREYGGYLHSKVKDAAPGA